MTPAMRSRRRRLAAALGACAAALTISVSPVASVGQSGSPGPDGRLLASGLGGTVGSTVGPDGALYVADGVAGTLLRVDPRTGATRVVASGLPARVVPGLGGAMDVAFRRGTAYVLVTLVGPDVGGDAVAGIYRVDGPQEVSVFADIGAFAQAHPPETDFAVPTGVQYALQTRGDGFLVTDGHHNRLYRVDRHGTVAEAAAFANVVPTGLDARGHRVLLAEAGPVPHLAETGRVVTVDLALGTAQEVGRGAPLAVDVELFERRVYALSQGHFAEGSPEGAPAEPDTGALMVVRRDGSMRTVHGGLDRPSSVEFLGHSAYVVTIAGEIYRLPLHHGR